MDMSEQDGAIFQLLVIGIIFGPFYLAFLLYGIWRRRKLVIGPVARWVYPASFPLALALIWCVRLFGTERINASNPAGRGLAYATLAALAAGVAAAVSVIVRTWHANHRPPPRHREPNRNAKLAGRVGSAPARPD